MREIPVMSSSNYIYRARAREGRPWQVKNKKKQLMLRQQCVIHICLQDKPSTDQLNSTGRGEVIPSTTMMSRNKTMYKTITDASAYDQKQELASDVQRSAKASTKDSFMRQ